MDLSFKESDFSKSSSYEIDKYKFSTGLSYEFQDNLYHSVTLSYELMIFMLLIQYSF